MIKCLRRNAKTMFEMIWDFIMGSGGVGIAGALGAIGGIFKSVKVVREASLGLKLRFGKVIRTKDGKPKIYKPGFIFLIPWLETLYTYPIRQQLLQCENQVIMLKDRTVFTLSAVVIFRVVDIYKAWFEIENLNQSIIDYCMAALRDEVSGLDHEGILDTEAIAERLLSRIAPTGEEWGVTFMRFKLTDCSPSEETARMILVTKIATTRAEALKEAAKVLGTTPELLAPSLSAALVGIPMVTSLGAERVTMEVPTPVANGAN